MRIKLILGYILTFFGFGQASKKNEGQSDKDKKIKMDIDKGFQIDRPNIFVPWDIDEKTLKDLFKGHELKHVTTGYYTINCTGAFQFYAACISGCVTQSQRSLSFRTLRFNIA